MLVFEIGLELYGGLDSQTAYRVSDTSHSQIASLTGTPDFLGIVSDVAIGRIWFDDTPTPGGMVLIELNVSTVPVRGTVSLACLGLGVAKLEVEQENETEMFIS